MLLNCVAAAVAAAALNLTLGELKGGLNRTAVNVTSSLNSSMLNKTGHSGGAITTPSSAGIAVNLKVNRVLADYLPSSLSASVLNCVSFCSGSPW